MSKEQEAFSEKFHISPLDLALLIGYRNLWRARLDHFNSKDGHPRLPRNADRKVSTAEWAADLKSAENNLRTTAKSLGFRISFAGKQINLSKGDESSIRIPE